TLQYFYADIYSNKEIVKILKEKNFVKYQIEINKILSDYIGSFDKKVLYDIVNDENNINKMFEILQKYIAYYLFFTIAAYYAGNQDNFINNIIEFSKHQIEFGLKIENFFNSESNNLV